MYLYEFASYWWLRTAPVRSRDNDSSDLVERGRFFILIPRDRIATDRCDTPKSLCESQSRSIECALVSRTRPVTLRRKFAINLGSSPWSSPQHFPHILPLVRVEIQHSYLHGISGSSQRSNAQQERLHQRQGKLLFCPFFEAFP